MDTLRFAALAQGSYMIHRLQDLFKKDQVGGSADLDLEAPWRTALSMSQIGRFRHEDLELVRKHVEDVYAQRTKVLNEVMNRSPNKAKSNKNAFTELAIEQRQDKLRAVSRYFASGPELSLTGMTGSQMAAIRASYAYIYDREKSSLKWSRFPWDVAFRELCKIKVSDFKVPLPSSHVKHRQKASAHLSRSPARSILASE